MNKIIPKISIIIPVYNADTYLRECLDKIITQSLKEIEIICINDNSKDNSLKILKEYEKKDKRIRIINLEETKGQSHARNEGMKIAKGEYIGFADADDFVEEKMYEKMYTSAKEKNAEIAMCKSKIYDEINKSYREDEYFALACFDEKFSNKYFEHTKTADFIMKINVSVWNKIYKRKFLEKIKINFAEGFIYEDLPFFYESYTKAKRVILVNEFLYNYRINTINSTMTKTDKNTKDRIDMVSKTYNILREQNYYEKIKSNLINWIIHDLIYRFLITDSKYQKEYFFRMKKFFKTIDTSEVDNTLLKSTYYPYFCEIKKNSYEEIIKYFFNQETNGSKYIKRIEAEYKKDIETLNKEILQNKEQKNNLIEEQKQLDEEWKKLEQTTKNRQKELNELQNKILKNEKEAWNKLEEETEKRKQEIDSLQERILQDEKNRWQEFNDKTQIQSQNLESSKLELANAWNKLEEETEKRKQEIDSLQERILQDEKNRWQEFNDKTQIQSQNLENFKEEIIERQKEVDKHQAEIDKAWDNFKIETLKREKELNDLQNRILSDEKERWKKYELKVADFEKECAIKIAEIEKQKKDIEIKKNLNRIALEKAKNYLSNKYIEEIEEEKTRLTNNISLIAEKEKEHYSELMKEQLRLQEENLRKINNFRKEAEEDIMQKPKISIILPVYNVAPYLRQSLDSIIGQTLKDIEIICIDDGSTDGSGEILDEYREKDERIKVKHKKNAGTGAARNDGLKLATGECIGFVDPDDWILPNMYERLYNILQEKELDIVMFTPDVYNDKTKKHEGFLYFQDSNFPKTLDNRIFNKDDISPFSYPMCVWNKLYRKQLFDDNKIDFAEGLDFEDHKVIFKSLFTAKRIYFIREKLYVYRHSREGSILSDNDTRMFDHIKIYDIVENILKETNNWEKFHLDFLRYKVHNILYYYTMIKDEYKEEYYNKMVKSLQATKMSEEEINILNKDYPELKPILENTLSNKIKKAVKKIIKKS
jgi:glycosyltransferase involved in cell wall biosynthesis